jgi:hypothetical protein
MNFTPRSEEECKNSRLLSEGTYDFVIEEAEEGLSKSGNDMITINVAIWDGDRVVTKIYDYLLEAMMFKVKHCCEAIGLQDQYQAGTLTADMLVGKGGKCLVGIQKGNEKYPKDKNVIKDYVPRGMAESVPPHGDDDMPDFMKP